MSSETCNWCVSDVDECETGLAACAHSCQNTPGSFSCVCKPGYELGSDSRKCYRERPFSLFTSEHGSLNPSGPKK